MNASSVLVRAVMSMGLAVPLVFVVSSRGVAEQQGPTCEARAFHCCKCASKFPVSNCETTPNNGDVGCTTTLCEGQGQCETD